MLHRLLHIIRYYPEQAFLFVFNAGVFAWLQTTGAHIANQIGLTATWERYVPAIVKDVIGDSAPAIQAFFSHSAVTWLVGSMIILFIIRFVKGILKLLLMGSLVVLGIYLIYRYQTTLQNLLH